MVRIRTTSCEALREVTDAIHVSSIMTPRDEFEYCEPDDLLVPKLALMKEENFDVIPMLHGLDLKNGDFHEYLAQENMEFKIKQEFKYSKDAAIEIEKEDRIPENLTMGEAILKFSRRKNKSKIPFFLVDTDDQITGLVTLADLDKTPVKVYLFALTSELELSLLEIISQHFERLREVCPCRHCARKRRIRDAKKYPCDRLEEYYYLYLEELIHIISKSEGFSENQKQMKDIIVSRGYTKIVELRNAIAHSKPLVSDKFPVEKLAESINLIKDLISTCKHNPGFMISVP
jgi:CBS domain-containing protein